MAGEDGPESGHRAYFVAPLSHRQLHVFNPSSVESCQEDNNIKHKLVRNITIEVKN